MFRLFIKNFGKKPLQIRQIKLKKRTYLLYMKSMAMSTFLEVKPMGLLQEHHVVSPCEMLPLPTRPNSRPIQG